MNDTRYHDPGQNSSNFIIDQIRSTSSMLLMGTVKMSNSLTWFLYNSFDGSRCLDYSRLRS